MSLSKSQLKTEVIDLAVGYLLNLGFKRLNPDFATAYASGKAARWVAHKYGDTVFEWIGDSYDWSIIISKSKVNMNEALEDLAILRQKKAKRLANKIMAEES